MSAPTFARRAASVAMVLGICGVFACLRPERRGVGATPTASKRLSDLKSSLDFMTAYSRRQDVWKLLTYMA